MGEETASAHRSVRRRSQTQEGQESRTRENNDHAVKTRRRSCFRLGINVAVHEGEGRVGAEHDVEARQETRTGSQAAHGTAARNDALARFEVQQRND